MALAAVLLLVSAGFPGAAPALAHTALAARSRDGEVLTTAPDTVSLTFTEPVQAEFTQVAVTDGKRPSLVIAGETTVDGPLVQQPVSLTANGTYTVAYRIVSADGHPVSGQLSFSYSGSAPKPRIRYPSAAPPSAAAAPASPPRRPPAPPQACARRPRQWLDLVVAGGGRRGARRRSCCRAATDPCRRHTDG